MHVNIITIITVPYSMDIRLLWVLQETEPQKWGWRTHLTAFVVDSNQVLILDTTVCRHKVGQIRVVLLGVSRAVRTAVGTKSILCSSWRSLWSWNWAYSSDQNNKEEIHIKKDKNILATDQNINFKIYWTQIIGAKEAAEVQNEE